MLWWKDLMRCPKCGEIILDETWQIKCCKMCLNKFEVSKNVVTWENNLIVRRFSQPLWKYIRYLISPYSSPFSPLRYFENWRINRFYQRTISDKKLASRWGLHYLKNLQFSDKKPIALEIGCGRGRNCALLNQLGFRTLGQDIVAHSWWKTLTNTGFQSLPVNMPYFPWIPESFDLILNVMVIHHIPAQELTKYFKAIFDSLKPGGFFILLEGNSMGYGRSNITNWCGRMHDLNSIHAMSKTSGFKTIDQSYEGFYSPIFPKFINTLRQFIFAINFDITDYSSIFNRFIPENKYALWLLRLQKP